MLAFIHKWLNDKLCWCLLCHWIYFCKFWSTYIFTIKTITKEKNIKKCARSCDTSILNHISSLTRLYPAFDFVPTPQLLNTFASVNTTSLTTDWLCSYLCGRKQYTVPTGKCSTSLLTQKSMSQGAILSPFFPSSTKSTFINYANDLTVCTSISDSWDPFAICFCRSLNGSLFLMVPHLMLLNVKLLISACTWAALKDPIVILQSLYYWGFFNKVSKVIYLGVTFSFGISSPS